MSSFDGSFMGLSLTPLGKKEIAYVSMILVALFWGINWPVARIVSTGELGANPITSTFIRFGIAIPFLYVAVKLVEKPETMRLPSEYIKPLLVLGIMEVGIHNFLFFSALRFTSASDGSLIINGGITTFTILLSPLFYGDERITRNKILGLICSITGLLIIFALSPGQEVTNRLLGNFLVVVTALNWSIFSILSKKYLEKISPLVFQFWVTVYGWLLLIPFVIGEQYYHHTTYVSGKSLASLFFMGVFAGAIAYSLFNTSVKYIGPSRSSIFINLTPVFGIISSILILGENFSIWYPIAFLVIIAGIFVAESPKTKSIEVSMSGNLQLIATQE